MTKMTKWLTKRTNSIWAVLLVGLGLYILCQLIPTAIGWTRHKFGVSMWLGTNLSRIDDRVGIGSIVILSLIIYLAVQAILDWRKRGKGSEDSKDVGTINAEIRAQIKKISEKGKRR